MALWVVSFNMSAALQIFVHLPVLQTSVEWLCATVRASVDFSGVQNEEISLNFHVFYKKIDQSGDLGIEA